MPQQRTEGGEPSAPATPGLLLLSYTTPRDAAINPNSIINRAPNFIACETANGETQIFLLKNGKVVKIESLSEERIYVDNATNSGTMLAGFSAFVTYKGDDFDRASNLILYYISDAEYEGHVTDFPVTKVTIKAASRGVV